MRVGSKYIHHTDPAPTFENHPDEGCKPWWYGGDNGSTRLCQNCPYPACIHDFCNNDSVEYKTFVKLYRKELLMAIAIEEHNGKSIR